MNTSVIIPIHEFNDDISSYLNKAIESIEKQQEVETLPEVILVYPSAIDKEVLEYYNKLEEKYKDTLKFKIIINTGNSDYQSQVNLGVQHVTTEYFSVLEFDDEYSSAYFKNVELYTKAYTDIDVFMPMIIEVNSNNEGMKYTNDVVWSQQFVGENGEMGYLNINVLKQYTDFKLSGAIIKKSEFENLGKYKSNIKLTFMYEFLLRALNNGCKIYNIPKVGYKHVATREGSMFDQYMKTMPMNERKFWFDVATKEANFMNDREIDTSSLISKFVEKK